MKRLIIGITSAFIVGIIAIAVFVGANKLAVLENLVFLRNRLVVNVENSAGAPCGNNQFCLDGSDNGIALYLGYSPFDKRTMLLDKVRKYSAYDEDMYIISDYGYALTTRDGVGYVHLTSDEQKPIPGLEDVTYYSSFNEFSAEQKSHFEHIKNTIIFEH